MKNQSSRQAASALVDLLEAHGAEFFLNENADFHVDLNGCELVTSYEQAAAISDELLSLREDVRDVLLSRLGTMPTIH